MNRDVLASFIVQVDTASFKAKVDFFDISFTTVLYFVETGSVPDAMRP